MALWMLLAASVPVPAADAAAIRGWLTRVYTSYRACPPGTPDGRCPQPLALSRVMTPATLRLMAADVRAVGGEVGVANDGDPICDCQDWGTIRVRRIDLRPGSGGAVIARVGFDNLGPRRRSLVLARTPGGWRVHDVERFAGAKSFRVAMADEIAAMRRRGR